MVLLSRKTLETASAKELFAWLKDKGSKATVGFAGVGSDSYVCATLLQQHAAAARRPTQSLII